MSQTTVLASLVSLSSGRTLESKFTDIVSCLDYGASTTGSASANTTAINEAIVEATDVSNFVLVPPGVTYNEASLVIPDEVTLLILDSDGTVTFLSKDHGASPISKGGIAVKSQGHTGVLLRAIDQGVSTEPLLQLVDLTTGDIAALNAKFIEIDEATTPVSPSANKARLFVRDDGAGNSQLCVLFPTGAVFPLAKQGVVDISASAVYDPANLVDGAGVTTTVAAVGAALGDFVLVSFSLDLQGIILTAYVSAADTVSIRFQNETGGAIDLGSGTLKVRVLKTLT